MWYPHTAQAGVDVEIDEFPGQQHSFQMAIGLAPEADDAITRFAAWARPKLASPSLPETSTPHPGRVRRQPPPAAPAPR
jgi:monoterpene epsilon-lactone hydrolase